MSLLNWAYNFMWHTIGMLSGVLLVLGLAWHYTDDPKVIRNVGEAVLECEKSLPRDQVCVWKVVAEPQAKVGESKDSE